MEGYGKEEAWMFSPYIVCCRQKIDVEIPHVSRVGLDEHLAAHYYVAH